MMEKLGESNARAKGLGSTWEVEHVFCHDGRLETKTQVRRLQATVTQSE
jgi:hypothetical protein